MSLFGFLDGVNNGMLSTVAIPMDTAQNVANLLRAAVGVAGHKAGLFSADQLPEMYTKTPGSSGWMKDKGLIKDTDGAGLFGELAGSMMPIGVPARAKEIGVGLLKMAENARAPRELGLQRGVMNMANGYKGSKEVGDYQIEHKPMNVDGGAAQLHDLAGTFGDDIYDIRKALQYFGSGADFAAQERAILQLMGKVRGRPDELVTIYRGVPDGVTGINPGDWVTLDRKAAQMYGNVLSMKVPASHVTSWPDSLLEFGYFPPKP